MCHGAGPNADQNRKYPLTTQIGVDLARRGDADLDKVASLIGNKDEQPRVSTDDSVAGAAMRRLGRQFPNTERC